MSTNVEDLYLKGFMAFSAKNYDSAKQYWEQVLRIDPNHEKAKKGLADLKQRGGKKRKTSKEVFQDIKRLYGEKNYAEALRLTELLLKKHPDNKDLQGLRKKLNARLERQAQAAATPAAAAPPQPTQAPPEAKSTMHMAAIAEDSVQADAGARVERMIQDGVAAYEVEDYPKAISIWEKALELDPNNGIAADYIRNVSAMIQQDQAADASPESTPTPVMAQPAAPEPEPAAAARPSKEDMMTAYNDAMGLFKEGKYHEALDKWNFILEYHPNHKETLQCVERTHALLENQAAQADPLAPINEALDAGRMDEAKRLADDLMLRDPTTPGLEQLYSEIKARTAPAPDPMASLELDTGPDMMSGNATGEVIRPDIPVEESHVTHSASEEQLQDFFEEAPKKATHELRQVSKVKKPKRDKKPLNLKLVIGVPLVLAVLGAGAWFGYQAYDRQLKAEAPVVVVQREIHWNSAQQKASDFLEFGNEFALKEEHLLAAIAYQRCIEVSESRLAELERKSDKDQDDLDEIARLNDNVADATAGSDRSGQSIVPARVDSQDMERAGGEVARGRFSDAAARYLNLLSNDQDNASLRDRLGSAQEKMAFKSLADNNMDDSFESFKRASVLLSANDMVRHHTEVINLFFQGKITQEEMDQWFYFFTN